jgi:hypothetical protein
MNLVDYAKSELQRAGLFDTDGDYGGMLGDACLAIITVFADQGHSGFSAEMTIQIVSKLMRYEPLTPLTSNPSEWMGVGYQMWQSKRKPSTFSTDGGQTWYDLDDPKDDGR